jgi:hypothetical protein
MSNAIVESGANDPWVVARSNWGIDMLIEAGEAEWVPGTRKEQFRMLGDRGGQVFQRVETGWQRIA